jgi:predicted MFS family arabinose efflux permease
MQLLHVGIEALTRPYRGFPAQVWRTAVAGLINATALSLPIYLSLFLQSLGVSTEQIATFLMLQAVAGLAGAWLGGVAVDRTSAGFVCKITQLAATMLFLLMSQTASYHGIVIVGAMLSLVTSAFRPAFILVMTGDGKPEALSRIIALRRVAINLGMALGAALSGLFAAFGFVWVFLFNAGAAFAALLILLDVKEGKRTTKSKLLPAHENFVSREVFVSLTVLLLAMVIFNQHQSVLPIYLGQTLALTPNKVSWVYVINGVLIALFQLPMAGWTKGISLRLVAAAGAFLLGLGMAVTGAYPSYALALIGAVVWTFGEMLFFPAQMAHYLQLDGGNQGKRMGMYQMVFSSGMIIGPALGISAFESSAGIFWVMCSVIGLVSALMFLNIHGVRTIQPATALAKG